MIATLQHQIASLEGVINNLRRDPAESGVEQARAQTEAATATQAACRTTAAKCKAAATISTAPVAGKARAPTSKATTAWQLVRESHSRRSKGAQEPQGAAPLPFPGPMRVDGYRLPVHVLLFHAPSAKKAGCRSKGSQAPPPGNGGADTRPWPLQPRSTSTSSSTMASPWIAVRSSRPPWCTPARSERRSWANTVCALAPLVGLLPGVLCLQDLLAAARNGWWHCSHRTKNKQVWITAVDRPSGREFGTTGATVRHALHWRWPQDHYPRPPSPDSRSGRVPYMWRRYLAPIWWVETGVLLQRQVRPRRVKRWDNPSPCWFLRPRRRFTLFGGEMAASSNNAAGADWWCRVRDSKPACQPSPYHRPEATWRDLAHAVHTLLPVVTDVW